MSCADRLIPQWRPVVDRRVRSHLSFLIVLLPAFSVWLSFLWLLGTGRLIKIENLAKEGLFLLAAGTALAWNLRRGRLAISLRPAYAWMAAVGAMAVVAVAQGIPAGSVARDARDAIVLAVSILVGYYFVTYRSLRASAGILLVASVAILAIEWILTPVRFWIDIGFGDYLLHSQGLTAAVAGSGDFAGYYTPDNIDTFFKNYDSLDGADVVNFRYGGLLGNPIVFGHLFSFITCFFFYDWKIRARPLSKWAFLLALLLGSTLLRTKGYGVSVAVFLAYFGFIRYPAWRIPIILFSGTALAGYLSLAFKHNLTAAHHIFVFYGYWNLFLEAPLLGHGMGFALLDDSFLGRLMAETGIVLPAMYAYLIWALRRKLSRDDRDPAKAGFVLAAFLPTIFTTAGIAFLSIYLYGLLIGCLLRDDRGRPHPT